MARKGFFFGFAKKALDAEARLKATGQFIALLDGMVHYEIDDPLTCGRLSSFLVFLSF